MTRRFYVTCITENRPLSYLAGPYDTHGEALEAVEPARKLANDADPWSHFYSFGTASRETDPPRVVFGKVAPQTHVQREMERRGERQGRLL